MPIRIAVVQFFILHWDRERNFERIENFTKNAKESGANIVVFPEDCITGSIFGDVTKLDATNANRDEFCRIAKQYEIDIVTGSSMEKTSAGNMNIGYYINAHGDVLGAYAKNHLYPSEYAFLTPGTEAPVFKTDYGNVGIVICWDMLFPEIFARMRAQNVDMIFCPSYWYQEIALPLSAKNPNSESELLDALCLTRAVEANAALIYCNAAGIMKNPNNTVDTLIGHSQVTLPCFGALHRLPHNNETIFFVDVDLDILKTTAQIYKME